MTQNEGCGTISWRLFIGGIEAVDSESEVGLGGKCRWRGQSRLTMAEN